MTQRLYLLRRVDVSRGPSHTPTNAPHTGVQPSQQKWRSYFEVMGSTGVVYRVTLDAQPSCDCPDESGHSCKHLLWVYLRVLGVGRASSNLQQRALLQVPAPSLYFIFFSLFLSLALSLSLSSLFPFFFY
ncbi:hypothetical protein T492DRAFT_173711 [Pavlovales sp. CCMP2436]|nr:hypothetical protein T492DRAFT_173711 [Pavlovales sp. CCMP2436]